MQDGVDRLRSAIARQPRADLTLRYSDRSAGATHATVYHSAAEEALRWLYPAPEPDAIATPWYMIEGGTPAVSPSN